MTIEDTRRLGIEFERRVQTMIHRVSGEVGY